MSCRISSAFSRRAEKDRVDRERLIQKANKLLESKAKIRASNKRGGKKYLKEVDCTGTWILDEEAIARDKQFDGYYGIQTSEKEVSAKDILAAYHNLWRIEEFFRIMKSTLEVREEQHILVDQPLSSYMLELNKIFLIINNNFHNLKPRIHTIINHY